MVATMKRDLNDVAVFTHVVDAGSFSGAARRLSLPTSAVSRRVARLEESLGARLLHRTTRKLSLTEAGRTYYQHGAALLEGLNAAEQELAERQTEPRGRVRVTAPVELSGSGAMMAHFLAAHPEVHLELDLTNRYIDLAGEGYDAAIRAGVRADSSLGGHRLCETRYAMVATPAYLQQRGTPAGVADLRDHNCLLFGLDTIDANWSLRRGRNLVKTPITARLATNNWVAIKQAVLANVGIALMPEMICASELAAGTMRAVLPRACPSAGSIWIVYPSRRHLSPAVRAFVLFIRRHFREHALKGLPSSSNELSEAGDLAAR